MRRSIWVGRARLTPNSARESIPTFCPPGGVVLDPFCGSGSTLVAAMNLGRPYYGFQIVDSFCEIARGRLAETEVSGAPNAA
jgi:site-specific DNA-methyltransferase (adenine-specific)